jgi:hypothetical protein
MKRVLLVLLVLAAIAAGLIVRALPPRPLMLAAPASMPPIARGALHVHSRRSDGTGTPDRIAVAASRAGLQFVILTDHGDAAREPEPPTYLRNVLLIDAVEVSTDGGHVVGLGLPKAPYRLGGEARDVLEDIRRLGGFAIAAHPGSAKPDLRWLEWTSPVDGLEWLNGDSEWRDEPRSALLQAVLTFPFRQPETLARLFDRSDTILRRWDAMTARRQVVAVAAGDTHARIGIRSGEPTDNSLALPLPSYESVFRAMSIAVSPVTVSGDAAADARAIVDAIRAGHVYSSIDALAAPAALSFTAVSGTTHANAGDILHAAGEVELRIDTNAPDSARIVLLKHGEPMTSATGKSLTYRASDERAVYRVEIHLPGAPGDPPVPWILSNPVYVGFGKDPPPPTRPPPSRFATQYDDGVATGFTVETSPRSAAALDVVGTLSGTQLSLRWALGGTDAESPHAALVKPAGPALSGYDRLLFTARADQPMRLSVQLRVPTAAGGERWHRSVYIDETPRQVTVFFDEMAPRGVTTQRRPVLSDVRDLLLVIDTVNTKPGTSGVLWIDDVKYAR